MTMSNLNQTTGVLTPEQLDSVSGGARGEVVIIGCTTRPPMGGYPPGTVTWNPWIGQPYPQGN
jgi:hypothetical protein